METEHVVDANKGQENKTVQIPPRIRRQNSLSKQSSPERDIKSQRTSFHKAVFLGPEYFTNILGTNSHIKGTCIAANFESNGPLVWCLLPIKSGWGNSIQVLPEVMK